MTLRAIIDETNRTVCIWSPRSGAVSGYIVESVTRCRYSAEFVSMHRGPPGGAEISIAFLPFREPRVVAVAAHGGLVCCRRDDYRSPRYYVCKPATRQWWALPNPRIRFRAVATAMVARPSGATTDFRIVRLSFVERGNCLRGMHCEVFDSRSFTWRRSADIAVSPYSLLTELAVRAHGAVHWLRCSDNDTGVHDIFAFDVNAETWRLIRLPPEVDEEDARSIFPRARKIVAVEDKLCLLLITGTVDDPVLEMWTMASYADERWEKKTPVSLTSVREQHGRAFSVQDICSPDVAFLATAGTAMWYDLKSGKMVHVMRAKHMYVNEVFRYESDLVPCRIGKEFRGPTQTPAKELLKTTD